MRLRTFSKNFASGLLFLGLFLGLYLAPVEAQPLLARLHEFVGYECAAQNAGLVEGRDGRLYGWIGHAGQDRRSVLWTINRDGSGFTVLHTFSGLTGDGEDPTGLVYGSDHVLYGVASDQQSLGRIFALAADGNGYRVLKKFDITTDQTALPFGLIEARNGRLYGVTGTGSPLGAVYGISKDGSAFQILARFQRPKTNGQYPRGLLLEGPAGQLYGVTASDRTAFLGTVYRMSLDGSGFETLHTFTGGGLGAQPDTGLVLATDGYLDGQAARGGAGQVGGVFKLQLDGSGYQFHPTGAGGTQWYRGVIESGDGFLYGAQPGGGPQFNGTLFRMRPDGAGYETLHAFSETTELPTGVRPKQLLHGSDGQLYCLAFQRSPKPIASLTVYSPVLLRFGPVPLPGSSAPPSLVPSYDSGGAGGKFRMTFTGKPGRTYQFQFTDSFPPQWQGAGLGIADGQGKVEFSETLPAVGSTRFYRVFGD